MTKTVSAPPIEDPDRPGRINPALFIDRELSWLAFNRRVLEEAEDARHPLLERLKFVAIFSANLDEFFMVRVAGIKEQLQEGVKRSGPSGLAPRAHLQAIRRALLPMLAARRRLLHDELLPALREAGVAVLRYEELSDQQRAALDSYYAREVFPVLTPLAVDPSHPFPFISNLSVNLAVLIDDPQTGERFARVKVPEVLPRLVPLPPEVCTAEDGASGPACFVWLEGVIAANLHTLFPGKTIREIAAFRITRDADLEVQEEEAADLLRTMEDSIRQRRFGAVVRLTIHSRASTHIRELLMRELEVEGDDLYEVDGAQGLRALMALYELDRPDLKDLRLTPALPPDLSQTPDLFEAIRRRDVLLHHPFDSFAPVVDLVRAAAADPQVLAIKQTLYRVGRNSPLVQALIEARERGKQVAVLVELKARFDEENNIEWARAMERAGVHVAYGLLGLKTHAKLLLVVRKEEDGLRRYVHLGTGNYNASTARMYTDLGLLTCSEAIGADVSELFNVLTGYSDQTDYRRLLVAPNGLRRALLEKIEREVALHQRHGNGRVIVKCNALTDEGITLALYRAAEAGVRIDLIIRGICSLRPGIVGLSETARVRSVVGRFLEHSRIYYFHNNGDEEIYVGSADLMERNLDRRVETLFPIDDARLRRYLRDTVLEAYLRDTAQARELGADGSYTRPAPDNDPPCNAQAWLLEQAGHPLG
ncbi:MAG TPA: polyphosphate kinase 1 [Roseiflexaceae bacterium]|nr:polyphosphate kinase 1 [Roseiflexaceae bacterium]